TDRRGQAADEKRQIATKAATLLEQSRTIFLDIGTTALAVAGALADSFEGTVITPSMRAAYTLSDTARIEVIVPGGKLRGGDMSLAGPATRSFLADVYPDIAFLGTGGVDIETGITDFELDEIDIKRTVVANSDRVYALTDS